MKYTITPTVIEGQDCFVLNYRKKPRIWESGIVYDVEARLRPDGSHKLIYTVRLDRTTTRSWGWPKKYEEKPLFLTVGDDAIKKA